MSHAEAAAAPWADEAPAIARGLSTDLRNGLSSAEARRRLGERGPNTLAVTATRGPWRVFARQFANTMVAVLAVAAVITAVIGDVIDTVLIGVIILLNAVVGFIQEHRAEQAVAALKRLTTGTARVIRDGRTAEVPTPTIVPGDIVELSTGDLVPADLRLFDVHHLRVDQAALTGESEPTAKTADPLAASALMVGDQDNMAFSGTAATYGRARGLVVATGMDTELGQIAALLEAHAVEPTPLQRHLAKLGRRMAVAAIVVCVVVFAAGLARGELLEDMFLTAVSLAVSAIPEGLPAVVTVSLALGAKRMVDRHAIIRRLAAVETLGSVTVICSDKTGTLTENRMVVERVWTPIASYRVTGHGYAPEGELLGEADPHDDPYVARLARVAAACNDAVLHAPTTDEPKAWTITGDPTEGALAALAAKLDVERDHLERRLPRIGEVSFDAGRRRMSTIHRDGAGSLVATKGATDTLLALLDPCDAPLAPAASAAAHAMADEGYRVLALADRRLGGPLAPNEDPEQHLRLVGIVGIADPPRSEVEQAINACRSAGITAVMITGDHPRTAVAVGRRLGLIDATDAGQVTLGTEVSLMDDDVLAEHITDVRVFARTGPEQKLRIVDAWKRRGAIVAMTGDGVNDAPALRKADIGVAMGISGTDVSKEAADMVLADDDFATIVHAVEEGRRIYDNIRRFVRYILTTHSAEVWLMVLAPFLGLPLPLVPIQILWVNLVTDGAPAVALGLEAVDPDSMRRPPRPPRQSILAQGLWQHAVRVGVLMGSVILALQAIARAVDWPWQTMVFTTFALMQLGHAVSVRREGSSVLAIGHHGNRWLTWAVLLSAAAQLCTVYVPALHGPFRTEPLTVAQLAVVLGLTIFTFLAVELDKVRRGPARADQGAAIA